MFIKIVNSEYKYNIGETYISNPNLPNSKFIFLKLNI